MGTPMDQVAADLRALAGQVQVALGAIARLGDPTTLAGDPGALRGAAAGWRALAADLRRVPAGLGDRAQHALAGGWHEPATQAFSSSLTNACAKAADLATHCDGAATTLEDAASQLDSLRYQLLNAVVELRGLSSALQGPPDPALLVTASQRAPALLAELRTLLQSLETTWQALLNALLALMLTFEHAMRSVPTAQPQTVPHPNPWLRPAIGIGIEPGIAIGSEPTISIGVQPTAGAVPAPIVANPPIETGGFNPGGFLAALAAAAAAAAAAIGLSLARQRGQQGNVKDTGIVDEVNARIASGKASDPCEALAQLLAEAKAANDTARIKRIQTTQKGYGCRQSRLSSSVTTPADGPIVV